MFFGLILSLWFTPHVPALECGVESVCGASDRGGWVWEAQAEDGGTLFSVRWSRAGGGDVYVTKGAGQLRSVAVNELGVLALIVKGSRDHEVHFWGRGGVAVRDGFVRVVRPGHEGRVRERRFFYWTELQGLEFELGVAEDQGFWVRVPFLVERRVGGRVRRRQFWIPDAGGVHPMRSFGVSRRGEFVE